jgi:hypothetical protein
VFFGFYKTKCGGIVLQESKEAMMQKLLKSLRFHRWLLLASIVIGVVVGIIYGQLSIALWTAFGTALGLKLFGALMEWAMDPSDMY